MRPRTIHLRTLALAALTAAALSACEIDDDAEVDDLDTIVTRRGTEGKLNLYALWGLTGVHYDTSRTDRWLGDNADGPYKFNDRASSLINKTDRIWFIYENRDHDGSWACIRPRSYIADMRDVDWPGEDDSINNELSSVMLTHPVTDCGGDRAIGRPY